MSILGLIISVVIGILIATQRSVASTSLRLDDIDQARLGIDKVTRTVRTAVEPAQLQTNCTSCTGPASTSTAFTSATTSSVQLFSNTGSPAGPSLVTFTASYDSTKNIAVLTETEQAPDAGSAPNFTYTQCTLGATGCLIKQYSVARGLQWPLTDPLFVFYDNSGAEMTPPTGGSLPAQQLIAIDSVGIKLTVQTPSSYKTGPTTVYDRVALPNSGSGVLATPAPTG